MNRLSTALLALMLCAPLAFGDDEPPARRPADANTTISVNIDNATAAEAVQQIGEAFSASIIIGPRVLKLEQRFYLDMKDVTVLQALERIAITVGARAELAEYGIFKIYRPRGTPEEPALANATGERIVVKTYDVSAISPAEQKRFMGWADRARPAVRIISVERLKDWVVYATPKQHNEFAAWQKAAPYLEAARALKPKTTHLRFFDVKDLLRRRYDKLPARVKRLFPGVQQVELKNGILIVRGTTAQLEAVGRDLDKLRDPFSEVSRYAGRRNAKGGIKLPPPPPPSGIPARQPDVGRDASKLPPPLSPTARKAEQEAHQRAVEAYRKRIEELRQVEADRAAWQKAYDEQRARFVRERDAAKAAEEAFRKAKEENRRVEEANRKAKDEHDRALPMPTEEEWERAAHGPRTLGQRIESLHAEVRALRGEVRALRTLLQNKPRRAPK